MPRRDSPIAYGKQIARQTERTSFNRDMNRRAGLVGSVEMTHSRTPPEPSYAYAEAVAFGRTKILGSGEGLSA